ncbi:hypothetical protein [Cellulomonas wangsupingiae]|uniref:Integral membrane protein n=1 Tax=Cellulomonas wangsupingiae TaxID=2968085 RepID=A0ABY5K6P4_9CELL|nr:hypothetical protein [Cellulomonas wangsupingiae]MCC2333820.1 hypothetical protein [Cellulomonas wangsupingiae]MCM0639360.1 hypothetical protein [Cellulomonas wangsupingiae]UUI65081.1 hypothetical protein NP075_18545 [Cellulomonas wangsupingiae]
MNANVLTYLVYLAVSVGLTIWVARTLTRNGEVFLVDVFRGDERIAAATNRLLVVGFYLVNLGFVALNLQVSHPIVSTQDAIEALASRLGGLALLLGVLHLVNVLIMSNMRRRRSAPAAPHGPYGATPPYTGQWTGPVYGGPPAPRA